MATAHQFEAASILSQLSGTSPIAGQAFSDALTVLLPGWADSTGGDRGYVQIEGQPNPDVMVAVSRALHASLPAPINAFPFEWTKQHGFSTVLVYAAMASDQQMIDLLTAASAYNQAAIDNN